jgi:alpha-tubulin suppressor-like RCC1 family protein
MKKIATIFLALILLFLSACTNKAPIDAPATAPIVQGEAEAIDQGQSSTQTSIISVCAGDLHSVVLKSDGTVYAVGDNTYGQCDLSDWTDIVSLSASTAHTAGVTVDGSVIVSGMNKGGNTYGQCNTQDWKDIISVGLGTNHTVGLRSDGTVLAIGDNLVGQCNVENWSGIKAISVSNKTTFGLKEDGTVVATGDNKYGQCNVADWTDIAAIYAGAAHTLGLKNDGTVVATGRNEFGECEVSDWSDIIAISASAHSIGLKRNGTVVATGYNKDGQCNVESWNNITFVSAGFYTTLALKTDGTVLAIGGNDMGQCNMPNMSPGSNDSALASGGEASTNNIAVPNESVSDWGALYWDFKECLDEYIEVANDCIQNSDSYKWNGFIGNWNRNRESLKTRYDELKRTTDFTGELSDLAYVSSSLAGTWGEMETFWFMATALIENRSQDRAEELSSHNLFVKYASDYLADSYEILMALGMSPQQ